MPTRTLFYHYQVGHCREPTRTLFVARSELVRVRVDPEPELLTHDLKKFQYQHQIKTSQVDQNDFPSLYKKHFFKAWNSFLKFKDFTISKDLWEHWFITFDLYLFHLNYKMAAVY